MIKKPMRYPEVLDHPEILAQLVVAVGGHIASISVQVLAGVAESIPDVLPLAWEGPRIQWRRH